MAAKIQIGTDLPNEKVETLPPPFPRCNNEYQRAFHYRGKLFGSSTNKLQTLCRQTSEEEKTTALDESGVVKLFERPQSGQISQTHQPSRPLRPRRIQSAKGRLEKSLDHNVSETYLEKSGSQVSIVDIKFDVGNALASAKRPTSPLAVSLPKHDVQGKSASRPSSAKPVVGQQFPRENCVDDGVRPSVYGLKLKRQVFGSDPGIFDGALPSNESPYVLSHGENEQQQESQNDPIRSIPSCLEPLRPWLTTDISSDMLGVDPDSCLVFLSLCGDSLPEVPPPLRSEDDLAWRGDLPPKKPPRPKKYSHPFFERKLQAEWECSHGQRPLKNICSDDGTVLYKRYEGRRTTDVVRKEIQELENLMQGIGSYDSDCMIVQYQADITRIREMIDETMGKIPDRIKNPPQPPDTFGLRKFCADHDALIQKIRAQHDVCIEELALLESGMDLDDTQRYFSSRSLQVNVPNVKS